MSLFRHLAFVHGFYKYWSTTRPGTGTMHMVLVGCSRILEIPENRRHGFQMQRLVETRSVLVAHPPYGTDVQVCRRYPRHGIYGTTYDQDAFIETLEWPSSLFETPWLPSHRFSLSGIPSPITASWQMASIQTHNTLSCWW
jgi:hypothetical protein